MKSRKNPPIGSTERPSPRSDHQDQLARSTKNASFTRFDKVFLLMIYEYIIYYIECHIGVLNLYLSRERGLTHKSCQIGSGELEVAVHGNLLWGRCLLHACMISTGLLLTIGMWACSHSEDSMTISWSTWEVNTSPPFHLPGTRRHPPTRKDTPERMWFIRRWYPW